MDKKFSIYIGFDIFNSPKISNVRKRILKPFFIYNKSIKRLGKYPERENNCPINDLPIFPAPN